MADVWANSMACHPRATYHIEGCCHLVNSLSRFTCHIAGCKNSIRHIENRFSPYFIFLMQFRLWRAAAFVSSPIHLLDVYLSSFWIQCTQGDHSPDNVKFPDNSMTFPLRFTALPPMLSVIVSGGVGMQQCMIRNQNEMHKLSKVKNGCKYAADNKQF